ncbi:hypothetical protein GCM10008931_01200 [Oceanobacillus oncorhynchi subsp. oncorhynchi]
MPFPINRYSSRENTHKSYNMGFNYLIKAYLEIQQMKVKRRIIQPFNVFMRNFQDDYLF